MPSTTPKFVLAWNTSTHAEIHHAVMCMAKLNNLKPETITFWKRGEQTRPYSEVVRPEEGHTTEELVSTRTSTVGSLPIFPYDEFIVHFSGGKSIKFITPELDKENYD